MIPELESIKIATDHGKFNLFHSQLHFINTLHKNWLDYSAYGHKVGMLSIKCIFFMLQAHDEIKSNKEACDAMELKRKEL